MKKIFIATFLSISFLSVFSQQGIGIGTTKHERARYHLLQHVYLFTESWGKSDTATLSTLLANEYAHTDTFGKFLHRQSWLVYAASPRKVSNIQTGDVDVRFFNRQLALVTGSMSYEFGDPKQNQQIRFSQLWSKHKGHWKRTMFQATIIETAN